MAENEIKVPCDLDKESVEFLESKLGAKINPHLETEKDYNRAIFYFKSCGLQEESGAKDPNKQDFKINDCFFSKEKADLLFENVYREALKLDDFIKRLSEGEDLFNDPYFNASMAAHTATINEHLTPKLHNEDSDNRDNGNAQLMRTVSLDAISPFLKAFPNL